MPESWNTGSQSGKKCVWGGLSNPSQALPALCPQKGSSRDPAAMEEACDKSIPTHSRHDEAESGGYQSERIVFFAQTIYCRVQMTSYTFTYTVLTCVCNSCISSRRINHRGAELHALILCLHKQESLSCLEH